MIRAASVVAASLMLSGGVARAQEAPPPAAFWYGALQPSFWVGGTDGEGTLDQRGTGEAMLRLELAVHREPAETGATFAFGVPASLRLSFAGTDDLDSPLGTFRLGLAGAAGNRFRRGGDFPQAWDLQLIGSATLDESSRQPGASLAFRLRGESAFVAVEATAVREAYDERETDHGLLVGVGLPRASGNRAGLVMLGAAALTGVAFLVILASSAPRFH